MFEFLFKYEAPLFREGAVALAIPWDWFLVAAAGLVLAAWLFMSPAGMPGQTGGKATIVALRSALLVLVALILFQPRLNVEVPRTEGGRIAVLIDDSLSMAVAGADGNTPAAAALERFAPGGSTSARLETRFDTRYFRFGETAEPLRGDEPPGFGEPGTNLAGALEAVLDTYAGGEAPAVVVVSDGGDDAVSSLEATVERLRVSGAPVYAVDMSAGAAADVAVTDVRAPGRIRLGERFEAAATIRHVGYGGRNLRVLLEQEGLVVGEREITLPAADGEVRVDISHRFDVAGPYDVAIRVPPVEGESIVENNEATVALEVVDETIDVLHLEGEPRFDVKFIRRALEEDPGIRLVSLVHTSSSKLYRVGVERADELADGFPADEETLFDFEVVILGSVPATLLDDARQRLVVDFVSRRGGGLLLLGGRHAFAEGGFGGAPLADVMPVVLDDPSVGRLEIGAAPTAIGSRHAVLRGFAPEAWGSLPTLSVVNPVRRVKPGASVLFEGVVRSGDPVVALAAHRYGRGRAAAFPVRDSWRWQMHGDVDAEDTTHELLWRRLVRWLGQTAGGRLEFDAPSSGVPGRAMELSARVFDTAYRPTGDARVEVVIDTPDGQRMTKPLAWRGGDGRYRARHVPTVPGRYDLRASLVDGDSNTISLARAVMVTSTGAELHGKSDAGILRRLAASTGGRYYPLAESDRLLEDLEPPAAAGTELRRLPLWDMPALYLAVLVLAFAEWMLRRRRGFR